MNLLIVEDEILIAERLQRLLTEIFKERNIEPKIILASNLEQALYSLEKTQLDLVTLDLNLNGQEGYKLLEIAACKPSQTIVISAYRDQAITAFEYGVLDFVPKPFTKNRLEKAVTRQLTQNQRECSDTRYLIVKDGSKMARLLTNEIESIEGFGNYTKLHLHNRDKFLHEMGMEALLKILPSTFIRVHKSHIVNIDYFLQLISLGAGKYCLLTTSKRELPVGRSKVDDLKNKIQTTYKT